MYSIKNEPKDFIVEEVIDLDLNKGKYTYFKLKKENLNTIEALESIAKKLNLSLKNFGFSGNKDKKAITTQYCSVFNSNKNKLENLRLKNIEIEVIGTGNAPISLGDLKGNNFKIFVEADKIRKFDFFINYFGEQRFGIHCDNHIRGKLLLKKDFKQVCSILNLPENDPVNNLRKFGIKKLRFFLHSYQSYLWNSLVYEKLNNEDGFEVPYCLGNYKFLNKKIGNYKLDLPNFDIGDYNSILKKDGITKDNFLIKELPELVSETSPRDIITEVKGLKIKMEKDRYFLSFFLKKGSYATVFIKKLFYDYQD